MLTGTLCREMIIIGKAHVFQLNDVRPVCLVEGRSN